MGRPAVFVDRDGTLNRDCPYCKDPKDLYVFVDTVQLVKEYQSKGYYVFLITNQSGVHRGYFTMEELNAFNSALLSEMKDLGVTVDDIFICPHRPNENCSCRKPETGMVDQAQDKYDIDIRSSVVIGDRDDMDGELARRKGMEFIQVFH